MRVLITGITGFVAPYLATQLLDEGHEVYGVYRRKADSSLSLYLIKSNIINKITLLDADLRDFSSTLSVIRSCEPDIIFHLAAQSFVGQSLSNPLETLNINNNSVQNILEAIRILNIDSKFVFAGSSEEYGLQFLSDDHYQRMLKKYGVIFPEPKSIPELPIDESNLLRPMSPYAISKVFGDYLTRNYYYSYGVKTIVSRAFNHEGAGRGDTFVTSQIVKQSIDYKKGKRDNIILGNVTAFRDWSHVKDIINGYILLSNKAKYGDVYVQGSNRVNSVLSYLLITLKTLGYEIKSITNNKGEKLIKDPLEETTFKIFSTKLHGYKIDQILLDDMNLYTLQDGGLKIKTNEKEIPLILDKERFRVSDVPILFSNTSKLDKIITFKRKQLTDIINDQINYYND